MLLAASTMGVVILVELPIAAAETAIAMNRNDSMAHRLLALFELQIEHPERSRAMIEQAMRLSPRDPNHWASLWILARAQIASAKTRRL